MRLFFLLRQQDTFAFAMREKKDRIIAAIFSLIFALLCLVGIIISKINRQENYRSDYEKTVSIYEEMERAKDK